MSETHLRNLVTGWNRRLFIAWTIKFAGLCIVLSVGTGIWTDWAILPIVAASAAALLGGAILAAADYRRRATADRMARHLDRCFPELEESTGLFLKAPENRILETLQRARAERAMASIQLPKGFFAPAYRRTQPWLWLCAALLAVTVLAERLWVAPTLSTPEPGFATGKRAAEEALKLESVSVEIRPPAYTRLAPQTRDRLQLSVQEGATVVWRLQPNRDLRNGALRFGDGETLDLTPSAKGMYTAERTVSLPGFYTVHLTSVEGLVLETEYFPIEIVPDRGPVIDILEPLEMRSLFDLANTKSLVVAARIEDDFGVARASLNLTLARGGGENVRFRERSVPLPMNEPGALSARVSHLLDFIALEMQPGDELYGFVEAWDTREPDPNHVRSEAFMVRLKTEEEPLSLSTEGIVVDLLPAYFRSQRQIIIDTEKLIGEQAAISEREFRRRSHVLGVDQKTLRLRYGQFLGEEFESGIGAPPPSEPEHGEDHDHGEEAVAEIGDHDHGEGVAAPETATPIDEAMVPYVHFHDSSEIATFFSDPIKDQLKAALAQMWDAELRLKTFRPSEALPYEYKALELLKEVQQASRVYVKRVGFESPPIEPEEVRFTGDLTDLDHHRDRVRPLNRELEATIREALAVILGLKAPIQPQEREVIEKLGAFFKEGAGEHPERYLGPLNDVGRLLGSQGAGNEEDTEIRHRLTRVLWNHLTARPTASGRSKSGSELGSDYFSILKGSQPADESETGTGGGGRLP